MGESLRSQSATYAVLEDQQMSTSYYQRTINTILKTVSEWYRDILTEDEIQLLETLLMLENDPQRLWYRLFLRKSGWFRVTKLEYKDIASVLDAVRTLGEIGLIEEGSEKASDYLDLMGLDELKDFCRKRMISLPKGQTKRENLVRAVLTSTVQKQQTLSFGAAGKLSGVGKAHSTLDLVRSSCGPIVRLVPEHQESIHRISNLFFIASNGGSSDPADGGQLATAILSDLNRRRYAKYEVTRQRPIFGCRREWIQWEEANFLYSSLWESLNNTAGDIDMIESYVSDIMVRWTEALMDPSLSEKPYFLRRIGPAWPYTKSLSLLADAYEKLRLYTSAITIYEILLTQDIVCHGRRGQWYERMALNLHRHLGRKEEAMEICRAGLEDEHVRTDSRLALTRRLAKLMAGKDGDSEAWEEAAIEEVTIEGTVESNGSATGRKLLFRLDEDTVGSVEDLVLHHFNQNEGNWQGVHTESSVYTTLFGILFWDIIWMPIPDVFQSPFQASPLDFATDSFYSTRKEVIDQRLHDISEEKYWKDALIQTYNGHHGTVCVGISWESYSLDQLWNVMRAVGGPGLSTIFRTFAQDYKNNHSGMPDLILWRNNEDGVGRLEHLLVEVKSVRDRLSDAQRHWAALFKEAGVRMIVCKVKHP